MSPPTMTVLINPRGGRARQRGAVATLRELIHARLPQAETVVLSAGDQATVQARAAIAAGCEVVVAAGGDGTVNAVAQALVASPARLGVLPFGTFNHFARDLGLPFDLADGVDVLAGGAARWIDVGAVNERYFVNNASLGLYPALVKLREQQARSRAKLLRLLMALSRLLPTARPLVVTVDDGARVMERPVWLIFVGNGAYGADVFRPAAGRSLDRARLDVVVVDADWRGALPRLVMSSGAAPPPVLRMMVDQVRIRACEPAVDAVACDGEVIRLAPPFVFRSVPQALHVIAPPRIAEEGGAPQLPTFRPN